MSPLKFWGGRLRVLGAALACAVASSSGSAQTTEPNPLDFKIPTNYLSRLAGVEGVANFGSSIDQVTAFGVRSFPLPTEQDWRIGLVKHANYWEYWIRTRQNDTTFWAGVTDNGDAALEGYNKLEITHDPWKGIQYSGLLQSYLGKAAFSRATVGYAFTTWQDRIRIFNSVGVGYDVNLPSGVSFTPITHSQVNANYGEAAGSDFNWSLNLVARLYTFPWLNTAQWSVDTTPSFEFRPVAGLKLNASHLERFAGGDDISQQGKGFGSLNLTRYQETNATLTYRFAGDPDFGLGALRVRGTRNWTNDYTYLRNDVFLNFKALPFLIGPSVGYQWGPTAETTQMLYAIVVMGK